MQGSCDARDRISHSENSSAPQQSAPTGLQQWELEDHTEITTSDVLKSQLRSWGKNPEHPASPAFTAVAWDFSHEWHCTQFPVDPSNTSPTCLHSSLTSSYPRKPTQWNAKSRLSGQRASNSGSALHCALQCVQTNIRLELWIPAARLISRREGEPEFPESSHRSNCPQVSR